MIEQNSWSYCQQVCAVPDTLLKKLKDYLELLIAHNKSINLTAITEYDEAVLYHIVDSLLVKNFFDFGSCRALADVGTGGGLPGVPLALMFPDVRVILIEVVEKKRLFLQHVKDELGLKNVEISGFDWRTFVRQTNYPIDVVCARASLRPEDLMCMFKTSSPYRNAQLIYWAAQGWQCGEREQPNYKYEESYAVGSKKRKYVFFSLGSK